MLAVGAFAAVSPTVPQRLLCTSPTPDCQRYPLLERHRVSTPSAILISSVQGACSSAQTMGTWWVVRGPHGRAVTKTQFRTTPCIAPLGVGSVKIMAEVGMSNDVTAKEEGLLFVMRPAGLADSYDGG